MGNVDIVMPVNYLIHANANIAKNTAYLRAQPEEALKDGSSFLMRARP